MRVRTLVIGVVLLGVGAIAALTGVVSVDALGDLAARVVPILGFVVAITVVTELAAEAGVFAALAAAASRRRAPNAWGMWAAVVVLAVVCTVFLSLDTTAVLLTPVVVLLARHAGISPLPFALTTVWLANTASLLLPVSNLTNLLAQHRMDALSDSPLGVAGFAALMWAPALAAVAVPVVAIAVLHRRELSAPMSPSEPSTPADRPLFVVASVVLVLLAPALVTGVEVWIPATIAALVLVVAFAVRRPRILRPGLVPFSLLVFASGLFITMESAHALGLSELLGGFIPMGDGAPALAQVAGAGMLAANAVDNLPAYLALEPVADSPLRLAALLIGVNAGPLITPWASLATLLWHDRLRSMGVEISWRRYMLAGLVVAPVTVAAAVGALIVARIL